MIPEIGPKELQSLIQAKADIVILDVRNQDEYQICNLGGHLIPLPELQDRLNELGRDQHIIVHCHAGNRSRRATEYLISQGYTNVFNLRGGITAWATEVDPNMPIKP